jgi:uncharacterized protein
LDVSMNQDSSNKSHAANPSGIHLMAKPAGPACNLRCEYCFYLEKESLFAGAATHRMNDEVLDAYIRNCAVANMDSPGGIVFAWQGGEPTLMGLDFYRKALTLEKKYAQGRPFSNTLQTNGMLLDDEWCRFLAGNNFLVGLSLDGPREVHDRYRRDAKGEGTFARVLAALKLLQKHGVQYNVMACVAKETAAHPREVYSFFKAEGVEFIQFLPVVERTADAAADRLGLKLGIPPSLTQLERDEVTSWTVQPNAMGEFWSVIFDEWVRSDVGRIFVMNFEWALNAWMGGDGATCHMSRRCGNCLIVEQNGDVYSCDHFVYPEFCLGNVLSDDCREMVTSEKQTVWGMKKETCLPRQCRECEVGNVCRGGCPKHRFRESYDGECGLNYLCTGYRSFHLHTRKYMLAMAKLAELGLPCEYVMQAIDRPVTIPAGTGDNEQAVTLWIK